MLRAVGPLEKASALITVFDEEPQRVCAHWQKEGIDHLTPQANYLDGASVIVEEGGLRKGDEEDS